MKGWIIYSAYLKSDKFIDFANMLKDAGLDQGHEMTIKTNDTVLLNINQPLLDEDKPDYVIFIDKDIYLARSLEIQGIRVFNSADAIEISDDKIKTYQKLAQENIIFPKTFVLPKTFNQSVDYSETVRHYILSEFGLPFIIKEAFGSFGEQVYLIENEESMDHILKSVSNKPAMIQSFISSSYGVDLRLQVVGNEVVAAMKRKSDNDFRANITSGGKMLTYKPTSFEKKIAIKASQAIGADFSGVDLLIGENQEPIVCEVNSNAHIRNLLDCTGINAAEPILKYIEKEVMKNS